MATPRIEPLRPDHPLWSAFEAALRAEGMPTEDLHDGRQSFLAVDGGGAFGGYGISGQVALVRSMVAAPTRRGEGFGEAVLIALLDAAREAGASEAWLLTLHAASFFARHGFAEMSRAAAPAAITASAQFASLCPSSAVLMCRKPV